MTWFCSLARSVRFRMTSSSAMKRPNSCSISRRTPRSSLRSTESRSSVMIFECRRWRSCAMDCSPVARWPVSGPECAQRPGGRAEHAVCVLNIPVWAVLSTGRNGPVVDRRTTGMFVILPFLMLHNVATFERSNVYALRLLAGWTFGAALGAVEELWCCASSPRLLRVARGPCAAARGSWLAASGCCRRARLRQEGHTFVYGRGDQVAVARDRADGLHAQAVLYLLHADRALARVAVNHDLHLAPQVGALPGRGRAGGGCCAARAPRAWLSAAGCWTGPSPRV